MDYYTQLKELIRELRADGINNETILSAIASVPRHLFVPKELRAFAYANEALPIGNQQTISQPYVVARMTQAIFEGGPTHKVLEIGTGSGYQAAVLSQLYKEVYSVERIKIILDNSNALFKELNLTNIHTLYGDGHTGWEKHAPYDGIIVTAAARVVPLALFNQLADQGRMIIPVTSYYGGQELQLITKKNNEFKIKYLDLVMFVPMRKGLE